MATIMFLYSGSCKYDLRNNVLLSFLDQALDLVYTAEIREKEGGTYGVSCNGSLGKYPKEELVLQIVFQPISFFKSKGWYPFACKSATADNARVWKSGHDLRSGADQAVSANARIRG